jgi:thiol-disulfide isomerase/thioredoxin
MNLFCVRRRFIASAFTILVGATLSASVCAETPAIPAAELKQFFASDFIDHQGHRQAVSQWRGKILVVNFWATWCAPCREEMPDFSRLQEKYSDRGVQFLGIAIESREKIAVYADRSTVSYPLLAGGHDAVELSRSLGNGVGGIPYTLVLGKSGEPLLSHTGRLPAAKLDALLNASSIHKRMDK